MPHMIDQTGPKRAADPFFQIVHDGEWNACVGIQGDAENYVDGYIEAAQELVAAVIDKRMVASRDTLAMPILYNCRHALELALKFAIDRLHATGTIAELHPVNHDILAHWRHLRDAGVGDALVTQLVADLEPFVTSLAAVDEDGQELRYASNRKGQRSLGGIAVVNLPLIRRSIERMSRLLHQLKARVHDMERERATGSQTKECSRADLEVIAGMLGDHAKWCDSDFEERKARVRERFGLSSRKLSDAIRAIRNSRPLAARVGLETELKHLGDEKAVAVLERWAQAHPQHADSLDELGTDYFSCDWDKVAHARQAVELDEAVLQLLNLEELSDLQVLFYVGRDQVYGEHYDEELTRTVTKHRTEKSLSRAIHHLMSKTNLLDAVADGARAVGRPTLAAKLPAIRLRVRGGRRGSGAEASRD
jgi:hypothetical protein